MILPVNISFNEYISLTFVSLTCFLAAVKEEVGSFGKVLAIPGKNRYKKKFVVCRSKKQRNFFMISESCIIFGRKQYQE